VSEPLLLVEGLTVAAGDVSIVREVGFELGAGQVMGVVGESGSGKTMTSLALLRLLPAGVRVTAGRIRFADRDVLTLRRSALRTLRGGEMAMIFQDPSTSLNPLFTIGAQIEAVLRSHGRGRGAQARRRSVDLLGRVQLPDPERLLRRYPHELSGGMRQRVMIAMALSCEPRLLIADEPTTALDVTVQAQILTLLDDLRSERGMAIVYISHDLAVVEQIAHRVAVMYAGTIVEETGVAALRARPLHPYTQALLAVSPTFATPRGVPLASIAGSVPRPGLLPPGCPFHPRCEHAFSRCRVDVPALVGVDGSRVACHLHRGAGAAA